MIHKHLKTGNLYLYIGHGVTADNKQPETERVAYTPAVIQPVNPTVFSRSPEEFAVKFQSESANVPNSPQSILEDYFRAAQLLGVDLTKSSLSERLDQILLTF